MKAADLERYRGALLEMRTRLIQEVSNIQEAIVEDVTATGDVSTVPTHLADFDAEGIDRNLMLAENEARLLGDVESALQRIEDGAYGACQDCGGSIAADRLEAIPFTPRCVRCAERAEGERSVG